MEKMSGDIIILHMRTINDNHMIYASWDMECDSIFCHLGPFFALLPTPIQKIKILKNEEKPGDIGCDKFSFFIHFGLFFALLHLKNQDYKNEINH